MATDIYTLLVEIVGEAHVSAKKEELYFYGRDAGLMPAHEPDYVVVPKTTEEVQKIMLLANREKIPIVPMGGGMSLAGLTIPLKGGVVVDTKRMRNIVELNKQGRYIVVEGGMPQGMLKAYLEKEFPGFMHSLPESPVMTTVGGSVSLHGQGHLTHQIGYTSDMVSGLEVVLATGDVCKIGSCSMSPYWFSKGPTLPDLSGLFLGWLGTTGIITKVGLKLYRMKKIRDFEIFVTDRDDLVPEILFRLVDTEVVEDLKAVNQAEPRMFEGLHLVLMYFTGNSDDEVEFKRRMIWESLRDIRVSRDGGFMSVFPDMRAEFLDLPQKAMTRMADEKKGGGFEYTGPIVPMEKYPVISRKFSELALANKLRYMTGVRVIGRGHGMMVGMGFFFNRADEEMLEKGKRVLHEAFAFALEHGGIPWKPTVIEQKMAIKRMDPGTLGLMKMIHRNLDPNHIMNPGNWEVE